MFVGTYFWMNLESLWSSVEQLQLCINKTVAQTAWKLEECERARLEQQQFTNRLTKDSCCLMQSRHFGLAGENNHAVVVRLQDVTAASLGNEVEVYWCCCRITFEIASCCSVFFLLVWRAVVLLVGVRLQSCFRWRKRCFSFYCFSLHSSLHSAAVCSITSDRSRRFRKKAIFSFPVPENNPDITAPLHITVCYVQLHVFACQNIRIQYSLAVAVLLSAVTEYVSLSGRSHWPSGENIHLSFTFSYNCTKPRPILSID